MTSNITKIDLMLSTMLHRLFTIPTRTKKYIKADITFAQLRILWFVQHHSIATVTSISHAFNTSLPTTTELVDKLVKNGHLKRLYNKTDRRVVNLTLLSGGKALLDSLAKRRQEQIYKIKKSLSKKEWKDFISALKILEALSKKWINLREDNL